MSLLSTGSGRAVETNGRPNYLSRDNPGISIPDGRGKRERKEEEEWGKGGEGEKGEEE